MSDRAPSPTEPSRVFLTGGSGLLGSHIAERLLGEGHEVVALHRPGSDTSFLKEPGCTLSEGDLRDDSSELAGQIEGCRWAVHCAARVYSGKDWSAVQAMNVDGTRNTLEAAARAGVCHAVHVSSVAVYGQTSGPIDAAGPLDGPSGLATFMDAPSGWPRRPRPGCMSQGECRRPLCVPVPWMARGIGFSPRLWLASYAFRLCR